MPDLVSFKGGSGKAEEKKLWRQQQTIASKKIHERKILTISILIISYLSHFIFSCSKF